MNRSPTGRPLPSRPLQTHSMQKSCARVSGYIDASTHDVARVSILPWHPSLRNAKTQLSIHAQRRR